MMNKKLKKMKLGKFIPKNLKIIMVSDQPDKPIKTNEGTFYAIKIFVEEKRPECIRIVKPGRDITVNNIYRALKFQKESAFIRDDKHDLQEIPKEFYQIATKAEIEAHKLGFHVGDEVWLKPEYKLDKSDTILGFYHKDNKLRANFGFKWEWPERLTKTPPTRRIL